ncbi:gamma-glutamyltransferase [Aurantiacibacter spongiae]|uniref:Glutathione hydrolase proenzyme n=1 Tax=Aurantiacibacter spongiae TaxID=2488860 RepID=A0A3N5DKV7_9SPHN|nr:gamma-glutamyltransferase [Aurantiacibacter spongiae]RPF71425.1 gamma-glutamyltransferase [Aurantiacibacter spongiae]
MTFRHLLPAAAFLLLPACATLPAQPATTHRGEGMVSAADPRAAQAGAEMLRRGGSATDAAIATMLALTVVEPQSSGIGGGGFYVHSSPDGSVDTIDGREKAPAEAGPDWFLDPDGEPLGFMEAVIGGRSVGVPGTLALAALAHERHGRLPWADLFRPAIALARNGWDLTERGRMSAADNLDRAAHEQAGRDLFLSANGAVMPVGTHLTNAALADTLSAIAAAGPSAFYEDRAEGLAAHVAEATPGEAAMRAGDLRDYAAIVRPPVCGSYRKYRICGMGPPSSGATTVIAILGQLETFDMAALGPQSPVAWHLFAESQRLAYADRELYLADSDFVSVPVTALTDPDYLHRRGSLISANATLGRVAAGRVPVEAALADGDEPEEHGTSHFAIVDGDGNAVSWTSTIEGPFGSGLMYGGFYLNNELTDFSFSPEKDGVPVANRVEGSKRPRSSMAPTLVFDADGRMVLAVGAAGGATIPVQVAKSLIGWIDWGMTAQQAIALPVLFSPGDTVVLERGSALGAMQAPLEALGHRVELRDLPLKANAVEWRGGRWVGAADPRSEGVAVRP